MSENQLREVKLLGVFSVELTFKTAGLQCTVQCSIVVVPNSLFTKGIIFRGTNILTTVA